MTSSRSAFAALLVLALAGCGQNEARNASELFDGSYVLELAEALSADDMQGRAPGTPESAKAREMIIERMQALGLQPVNGTFEHAFTYGPFTNPTTGEDAVPDKPGVNVIGLIQGTSDSDLTMVLTAHFDHLGVREDEIYNGMDDNASGVTGILAAAEYFSANKPTHDVLFVALDAEEDGFGGAREFITNPPVPLEHMAFNLNLDMVSRGDNGLLWASGSAHWPALKPMIEAVASEAPVEVRMGFDTGEGRDDWTLLSDHAVFFRAGIPHLYLGVEDHPDYHRPSDDFENVDQDWYLRSVETVVRMAAAADARLVEIAAMKAE
ncbi:MAG: M28 family peptidase [Henriciella sp.]|nr:M28 family peptidase [Henriciella sp.]